MRTKRDYTILGWLLAMLMLAGAGDAYALPASHYASSSKLAQGKWVKIRITSEGMQYISNEQLKKWGFPDPAKVNVYGYGGRRIREALDSRQPDDLPIQPVCRTATGLVFYGVGNISWSKSPLRNMTYERTINNYSTESCYFLSDIAATAPEMYTIGAEADIDAKTLTTFTERLLHEKEEFAPANTGATLLGEDFRSNTRQTFSFALPGQANDTVCIAVAFGAKTSGGNSLLTFNANGQQVKKTDTDIIKAVTGTLSDTHVISTNTSKLLTGISEGKLDLQIAYSYSGSLYLSRLDNIIVNYKRRLQIEGNALCFYLNLTGDETGVSVAGCTAETNIWDVTDPAQPMKVVFRLNGGTATFSPGAKGLREYVAFNPSKVNNTPALSGEVSNQDLHALSDPQMVIITLEKYKTQAERVAQLHRNQDGWTVHVITDTEIYNEFSSGTPDIGAYRKLCKMFYDRTRNAENPFGYCMLFGRGTYDNRAITASVKNSYPRLLLWQSTSSSSESSSYSTDNILGMLADSSDARFNIANAKMDIAVGRMPVKNETEARQMVDKLIKYCTNPNYGSWRNKVVILADDQDNAVHLDQAEKCCTEIRNSANGNSFQIEKLYLDSYELGTSPQGPVYPEARDRLLNLFDQGFGFMNYIGHANPSSWTHERLWTYQDITSMTNKNWPFIYHASCEFIRWDSDSESGAETMWLHPEAGVIGFIAANRKVYISLNGTLNQSMSAQFFNRDNKGNPLRVGDIFRLGMNGYPGTDDNKLRYCVMGDPAMHIFNPTRNVVVDMINGVEINKISDSAEYPVITALSEATFSGYIANTDGEIDEAFNGTIIPELYDAEEAIVTFGNGEHGKERTYNDHKNRLFVGKAKVEKGRWEIKVKIPEKISNNFTPPLLSCYAYSTDGAEANGTSQKFYISGWTNDEKADTVGPSISLLALDNEMWQPGNTVGTSTTLIAKFSDPSGINISSVGIGQRITAVIDNNNVYDNLTDYYEPSMDDASAGSVYYPLENLKPGEHTLRFIVWDNVGNSSSKEIPFRVANGFVNQNEINIYTNANPASVSATIFVDAVASSEATAMIEIFDIAGRKVWMQSLEGGNTQATWDLTDGSGNRVPRGIYLYRATVTRPDGTELHQTKKLAVTAPK